MLKQQLKEFLLNRINLSELTNLIEDRLFGLRQTPEITEEKEILSNLELLIHEYNEGLRSDAELNEAIKQAILPEVVPIINSPIVVAETGTAVFTYSFARSPATEYQCQETVSV
jgi:hypothetical protein